MPDHLQSFQLDFLTPDLFGKIVKKAVTKGVKIPGAHGNYINFHMGDMILVIRTAYDKEKNLDYITGFDSHAKGCCLWDCTIQGSKESEDITAKTLIIDNNGQTLPLPLINGDILTDYREGTALKVQVAAYPETLAFYTPAEAKEKAGKSLGKITPAEGDAVDIWGEAIGFRRGETTYMGGTMTRFLFGLLHTEQGDIEIVFPDKLVPEGQEDLLQGGIIVHATGELAANPAILEKEKGFLTEEECYE